MFTCCMCKKEYADQKPARKNNCGLFCRQCSDEITRRVGESNRRQNKTPRKDCIWCGKPTYRENDNKCPACRSLRDLILARVRYSSDIAKYVARIEGREGPPREERAALTPSVSAGSAISADVGKLKDTLRALCRELGVPVEL